VSPIVYGHCTERAQGLMLPKMRRPRSLLLDCKNMAGGLEDRRTRSLTLPLQSRFSLSIGWPQVHGHSLAVVARFRAARASKAFLNT
jgi:hypothetical protein